MPSVYILLLPESSIGSLNIIHNCSWITNFIRYRFIKKCLGAPSDTDVEQLKADNEGLKRYKLELEAKIENLQKEVIK